MGSYVRGGPPGNRLRAQREGNCGDGLLPKVQGRSAFTRNLLRGESVYLKYGLERADRYERLLAYLYRAPDGLFVNAEIVRQGYGHAYVQFPFEHMDEFVALQARAREAGKGLWAASVVPFAPNSRQLQGRQSDLKPRS